MLRQFEKELVEDREFSIGGELFEWRYPYWEDLAARAEEDQATLAAAAKAAENGGEDTQSVREVFKEFIDRIEPFLDPKNDSVKRWRTLTKRKVDPVPAYQYRELFGWLVEVTSARPTEQLLSSWNGQERTEPTSAEG